MCELLIAAFSWIRAHLSFKMLEIYLGGFEEPRMNACPTTLRQREQHRDPRNGQGLGRLEVGSLPRHFPRLRDSDLEHRFSIQTGLGVCSLLSV